MSKAALPFRPALTRMAVICLLQFCIFYLFQSSAISEYIEARFSRPMLFQARNALDLNPPFAENLKIFSFDDTTADVTGHANLNIRTWAELIAAIAKQRPKDIYIDALFALPDGSEADQIAAREILQDIKIPVITSAFVSPAKMRHRQPLPTGHPRYDALNLYREKKNVLIHGLIPMEPRRGWIAYGARHTLQPALRHAGHALNAGHGKAQAIIRLNRRLIMPHFVLMGQDPLRVRDQSLVAGSTPIPLDQAGRMVVDYSAPSNYYQKSRRLLGALRDLEDGKPIRGVEEGDTVLILPKMLTGGTDFTVTPLGPMPGGFVIASLLNSKIRGQWIQPIRYNTLVIAAACVIGGLLISLSGAWMWVSLYAAILGWFGIAIALFSWGRILPDVSTPFFAFTSTVLSLVALRHHIREKMAFILRVLKTENDELRSEILQAGEISRVFNPDRPPHWPDIEIGTFHESLMAASGDWFAFETSPSRRYRHFLMCDITGHGVQAAIVVSACKTVLSMTVQNNPEMLESTEFLWHYARRLNATLYQQGHGRHATTIAAITFDTETQTISYFCAGHPAPFHLRRKGDEDLRIKPLLSQNSPLGFFTSFEPQIRTIPYRKDDALLVFTDGAEFPRSVGAIKRAILDSESVNLSLSAKRLCYYLRRRYGKSHEGDDDVSIVWFRFHGEAASDKKVS